MKLKFLATSLFLLLLVCLCNMSSAEAADNIVNKPGDIIITNSTSSSGIVGHVDIYISATQILHTSGRAKEPHPIVFTEKQWNDRYKKSKVIRPKSAKLGKAAADKAVATFKGKKIPYSLTAPLRDLKSVYCSKLVWNSYFLAGLDFKVYYYTSGMFSRPAKIMPYDYTNVINYVENGFTMVDDKY